MNAQQRFQQHLRHAQDQFGEQPKMPYLCVVGSHDFDELKAELLKHTEFLAMHERIARRLSNDWDPFNTSCANFAQFKENVEQEEFTRELMENETAASSPLVAEAQAAMDPIQRKSLTDYFLYCGCHCFRSLNEPRGFWFA